MSSLQVYISSIMQHFLAFLFLHQSLKSHPFARMCVSVAENATRQKRKSGSKTANCNQNWGSREYEKVLELIAFTISGFVQPENDGIVPIIFTEDRQEMFLSSLPASACFCTKASGGQVHEDCLHNLTRAVRSKWGDRPKLKYFYRDVFVFFGKASRGKYLLTI